MIWIILTILFFLSSLGTSYFMFKFAFMLTRVEEAIENSLDILDQTYGNMSRVLNINVTIDSPEVRQIINELKEARNSILLVANVMSIKMDYEEEEKEEEEKDLPYRDNNEYLKGRF